MSEIESKTKTKAVRYVKLELTPAQFAQLERAAINEEERRGCEVTKAELILACLGPLLGAPVGSTSKGE